MTPQLVERTIVAWACRRGAGRRSEVALIDGRARVIELAAWPACHRRRSRGDHADVAACARSAAEAPESRGSNPSVRAAAATAHAGPPGPGVLAGQNGSGRSTPEATFVVGYDGSDAARRGLARVREMGARGTRVLVVLVDADLRSAGVSSELAGGEFDAQRLGEEASGLLDAAEDVRVEIRTTAGDPAVVLVEVAADLLVVGRRGIDFVSRTLLGSVAQRVVQQAPCDVLVVA
jgi:nucleotide-binding universal stress UspA family protein